MRHMPGSPTAEQQEPGEQGLAAPSWRKLGDESYLLQLPLVGYPGATLNIGLVVGSERALVVDTGCGPRQAAVILDSIRQITELPLTVVNTHAHYDHFFGNAAFEQAGVAEFWAQENAIRQMSENGEQQRSLVAEEEPEMAAADAQGAAAIRIVIPQAAVGEQPVLVDLGEVSVMLFSLGRGHTDGDLLVGTPSTLFAGDLVEEGGYPSFEDSFPADWADTLRQLSALRHRYEFLVPGHGEPMSDAEVKAMATTMSTAVRLARQATQETPHDATKAIPILPYGPEQSRWFISRLKQL